MYMLKIFGLTNFSVEINQSLPYEQKESLCKQLQVELTAISSLQIDFFRIHFTYKSYCQSIYKIRNIH